MELYQVKSIGKVRADADGFRVQLDKEFIPALQGLEGFSHIDVLWWFSGCDNEQARGTLTEESPYRAGPAVQGTFATRSPLRPNPIALSTAQIVYVDAENGVVGLSYIDAEDGTPLLDLKPYTPSLDRVEEPRVPAWCAHLPKSLEESAGFDWESEFNF